MNNEMLEWILGRLWRVSWQAGVLVLLVLAVQWIFRARLAAKWRHALWLLVLGRLVLPVSFESATSIFNYASAERIANYQRSESVSSHPQISKENENIFPPSELPGAVTFETEKNLPSIAEPIASERASALPVKEGSKSPSYWSWKKIAFGLWLGGASFLALRLVWSNIRFARKLRHELPIRDPAILSTLRRCEGLMNIRRSIVLIETKEVQSPALFGSFRPKILLPQNMVHTFSAEELRYIFLHELAHIRRRDLWINWLTAILQILHWFNPLVWLGFHRMRADRELACDALALLHVNDGESCFYGETILKLLAGFSRPPSVPGLVGILENKNDMKQRMKMIATFKKASGWPLLAIVVLLGLATISLTDAQTKKGKAGKNEVTAKVEKPIGSANAEIEDTNSALRPDLIGQVQNKEGSPIAATIFISTAGPKVGTSSFCPSCYADCRKSAKSGKEGNFKIESLDPQLRFRILVVAKGFKPKFVSKVDPAQGPLTVKMDPANLADAHPENTLRGRVVNTKGEPVEGAAVESHGIHKKDGGGMWGELPGVDPLAVTDEQGEFIITSKDPFLSLDVKVQARTFANKTFSSLPSGTKRHDLTLTEGATVTGRVLFNGKPLKNVSVGLVSVDRGMENYTGNFEIGTTKDGQFAFVNLPPNVDYYVYGIMNTIKLYGAIGVVKVRSGKDGDTADVGDLNVAEAYRLAGRVVLADGTPVPSKTRLLVSRQQAWDSMNVVLDQNGNFDTVGIPKETFSLSARVPGYRVSSKNASLDTMNPFQLVGRVNQNITNLVFLLEKGENLESSFSSTMREDERPQNLPLRGAEFKKDHSNEFLVSGRALDEESKQPIPLARVTPGRASWRAGVDWDLQHTQITTNGTYSLYFGKTRDDILIKAEAEGYLPAISTTLSPGKTNFDFVLKKGSGPRGTVWLPNGKPAAKISVALICPADQSYNLNGKSQIDFWQNKKLVRTTDTNGNFSFPPELEMQSVMAAGPDGIKGVSLETLAADPKIILEPWGKIKGTIKRTSGVGTNEDLDLTFAEESFPGQARLNPGCHALTDAEGRFEFDRVPPGELQITYRKKLERNSWQNENLQRVTMKPGQTLELKIVSPDRPTNNSPTPAAAQPKPIRKPGLGPKGIVFLPDGKPAVGADVALAIPGEYLGLGKAAFTSDFQARQDGLIVSTDAAGGFALPSGEGAESVIALHSEGYAKVSMEEAKSGKIQLQPWGRVEGTLKIGQRLGTNETVFLNTVDFLSQSPIYGNEFRSKTDEQGQFVISFVPPGEHQVARLIPVRGSPGSWSHGRGYRFNVPSGQSMKVTVGGDGRKVVGRVTLGDGIEPLNDPTMRGSISTGFPKSPKPLTTLEEIQEWNDSPECKEAAKNMRAYVLTFTEDGGFLTEDVAAGKYSLDISLPRKFDPELHKNPKLFKEWAENPKASLQREIVIPEIDEANRSEPLDLGTLKLKAGKKSK